MRKLFTGILLGLTLAFGGCSADQFLVRDPAKLETPVQKIQAAIDQVNATITAVAITIRADYFGGIYSKEEALKYFDKLTEASLHADKAQMALNAGGQLEAKDKLALANLLISALEQELVKAKNRSQ